MNPSRSLALSLLSLGLLFVGCSSDGGEDNPGDTGGNAGSGNAGTGNAGTGNGGSGNGGSGGGTNGGSGGSGGFVVGEGGSGNESGSGGFGSACAGETYEPEQSPTLVQVVVDTSLSMDETAPGSDRTKWEVTRDALRTALDGLSPQLALGLMFYPNRSYSGSSSQPRDLSACVDVDGRVPIAPLGAPGSDQRLALEQALDDAGPDGSTPTHDAYRYALENAVLTTTLPGRRFILLITDGVPTYALQCTGSGVPNNPAPTQPIVDEIALAASQGVSTFIIGSPGSEDDGHGGDARPWMSRGAIEGGTATPGCSEEGPNFCHFDMTEEPDFAAALADALGAIAGHVVSCSYDVPESGTDGQPIDRDKVNVSYTPGGSDTAETIYFNDDPDCSEGWRFEGEDQLVLCRDTCDRIQADTQASLLLVYGCQRREEPPE